MPFTLSHAVVAAPIAKLFKHRLPVAGIAIGSMTPDLYRLFTQNHAHFTHLWTALIHPNLWVGLLFCCLWYVVYRPVIYRLFNIHDPLTLQTPIQFIRFICAICLALMMGNITHILWDGLTHVDFRTLILHDFLAQNVIILKQTYPLHRVLQLASSFFALPILIWMCIRYIRKYQQYEPVSAFVKYYVLGLSCITLMIGLYRIWDYQRLIPQHIWQSDVYYFTGRCINEFTQSSLIIFTIGCLLFLFLNRQQRFNQKR